MTHVAQAVETFWKSYLASTGQESLIERPPEAWGFGDSPEMADELGLLVVQGIKTATCSLLWEYEAEGEAMPQVGELSIIVDGAGRPLCIIETVEVELRAYNDVDAQFAYDEGEGDRSLAFWRDVHWRFFSRACASLGRVPTADMPLVCERFQAIYLSS
jgi:uncharacterized protein YhfF